MHREQTYGHGESNMETYITICKIDTQWEFDVRLRELKPGLCINLEGTTEWLHFHFSLSCIGEEYGNPLQCSCLENPRDGGAWWAAVSGVAQSWTRLTRLSSSSSKDPSPSPKTSFFFFFCFGVLIIWQLWEKNVKFANILSIFNLPPKRYNH